MKSKQKGSATLRGLVILALVLWAFIGWFINAYEVGQLAFASTPLTTLFIIKLVGIFAFPVGAILGYL